MFEHFDTVYKVGKVFGTITFYAVIIAVVFAYCAISFTCQLLSLAAAYTNSKKRKSSKGAFTTGIILELTHSMMKNGHR